MKLSVLLFLIVTCIIRVEAQLDTAICFLDKREKVCNKDAAIYLQKFYKSGENWHKKTFLLQNNNLYAEGIYEEDSIGKMRYVEFKKYADSGWLYRHEHYKNGRIKKASFLYPNGKQNGLVEFDDNGKLLTQKGWNPDGTEIVNYVFEREAEFAGGRREWQKYLERNLNSSLPKSNGAPAGTYTVVVFFTVQADGTITEIYTTNDPGFGTKQEAIRVIQKSKGWIPSVSNNKVLEHIERQKITFMVSN